MNDELSKTHVYDEKTRNFLEQQFSRVQGECYVDHAGATLYSDDQIKSTLDDLHATLYTNPHSSGVNGGITEDAIDNIRYTILDHFHTCQEEYSVIFTSGATASLKLVAETFDFQNQNDSDEKAARAGNFVYAQDNHTSVLGMREYVALRGASVVGVDHESIFKILQVDSRTNYDSNEKVGNSLFAYSAQCNFSGLKYPLDWLRKVKNGQLRSVVRNDTNWYTLLDAASYVATNDLDLALFKPDFVCVSFYKMFGYPTGLGCLLVKNDSANVLKKVYYGGGTVDFVLSSKMFHVKRDCLHQRFEDGTIPFTSIVSLRYGFKILSQIKMSEISNRVFSLAKYLHDHLLRLHHENGAPVVRLYSDTDYNDRNSQGGIVTFNVLRNSGEPVGYMEVLNMASLHKIHLRTGCLCNPGACQRHLKLSNEDLLRNYDSGYTCGGTSDLVNGRPAGAIRASFGYMSTERDVEIILSMLRRCFVTGKEVTKYPIWWSDFKRKMRVKYNNCNDFEALVSTCDDSDTTTKVQFPLKNVENQRRVAEKVYLENGKNKKHLRLAKISLYPIKSCAAFEVSNFWRLTSKGLSYDREWMIVTAAGVCLTQKQEVKLCLIKPELDLKSDRLILKYPKMPSISLPLNVASYATISGEVCRGKICGHKVEGVDCGLEVSEWLSLALGRPNLKLVRQIESSNDINSNTPDLSFASQGQYLLLNTASISWLADRISDDACFDKSTLLYRFRGNLLIEGFTPMEETSWKIVKIGNCIFKVEKVCTRCQMICIDQTNAEKTVEPLRTLAAELHGKMRFGIYLTKICQSDRLNVGDEVRYFENDVSHNVIAINCKDNGHEIT